MDLQRVFAMSFAGVYPHYVLKAEKKGRTKQEVDAVLCWLTGYTPKALAKQIERKIDFQTFFAEAPRIHPNAAQVTGTICGVRIEEIEHPLMRKIRILDKLVDELAKGRPMEKVLRADDGASPAVKPARKPTRSPAKSSPAKRPRRSARS